MVVLGGGSFLMGEVPLQPESSDAQEVIFFFFIDLKPLKK